MYLMAVTHWTLKVSLRINGSLKTFAWYKYQIHPVVITIHCLFLLSLLNTMKFQLGLLLLVLTAIHAIVIQPQPTRTADGGAIIRRNQGSPTPAPKRFIKRDLEESLSLYENWANDCNNNSNDNNAKVAVSDLNNLWQTVTSTVYCGNGNVKTITKTVTATKQRTTTKSSGGSGGSSGNKKPTCDDKCWSTYLWRKSCLAFFNIAFF